MRVRGALWTLHKRTAEDHSAVFRKYKEMCGSGAAQNARQPHLFSAFLDSSKILKKADKAKRGKQAAKAKEAVGFSLDLGVLVPQYEVDGFLMFDDHFEGGYIYRNKINLLATPPKGKQTDWVLQYGFDSVTPNQAPSTAVMKRSGDKLQFRIPIESGVKPGIKAELVLNVSSWNRG